MQFSIYLRFIIEPYFLAICFATIASTLATSMGARRNFSRGGQTFGGAPKKSVKGGPHIFFRQALKYAYRGGGCSFDARRVFF